MTGFRFSPNMNKNNSSCAGYLQLFGYFTPTLHKSPLPPEGVAKDIRATVGCAVRTIPNKELRFLNGAHGAPYIAFTTHSAGEGLFLEFTGSELQNHRQTARYP